LSTARRRQPNPLVGEEREAVRRIVKTAASRSSCALQGGHGLSLVLAGVEYYFPIYREANSYPHLVEGVVAGNPEAQTIVDLYQRALGLVAPRRFESDLAEASARYRALAGTGRTSNRVVGTVSAALEGRVDVLFVAVGVQVWGSAEDSSRVVWHEVPESSDIDLLDLAAVRSLLQGGTVYAVQPAAMPDESPLAAILRY
jgi:hypothetical protein